MLLRGDVLVLLCPRSFHMRLGLSRARGCERWCGLDEVDFDVDAFPDALRHRAEVLEEFEGVL